MGSGGVVLDVRNPSEWKTGHIAGAVHIPAGDMWARWGEVPVDKTVHVICGSGYRSSVVTSILARQGLTRVVNVNGGMGAWNARKFSVTQ